MKNKIISGSAAIVLGLLVALGPMFLFKVCGAHLDGIPRCNWAARAELCMGILVAAMGICLIIFTDVKTGLGLSIGIFLMGLVTGVLPVQRLMGFCSEPEMACNRAAFPALIVLSALIVIGACFNVIILERKSKS